MKQSPAAAKMADLMINQPTHEQQELKQLRSENAALKIGVKEGRKAQEKYMELCKQLLAAQHRIKELREALEELVTLKAMKDELSLMLLREEGGMGVDYDRRKPLAWAAAKAILATPDNTAEMNEHKELAIHALGNMKGDNTARARAAFRNCTPEQMQEQYGQSGQTRAQIIAGYEAHDAQVQAAIDWVKAQRG